MSGVYWGAGRDSRYSEARRGIGNQGALGPPRDCRVCRGHFGSIRGIRGCRGVRDVLGWQVNWEPNHIGPQSRVPALPLVPLGE